MPIPFLVFLSFAAGAATAIAGRIEVRSSPRPVLLTRALQGFIIFAILVLIPASAYFYVFHGDWSLLYWVDTATVPSAVALLIFVAELGIGILGYLAAALAVRNHRESRAYALVGVALVVAGLLLFVAQGRLLKVGTYAQYHGDFGLTDYAGTSLMNGGIAMGLLISSGLLLLLMRLHWAGRQSS